MQKIIILPLWVFNKYLDLFKVGKGNYECTSFICHSRYLPTTDLCTAQCWMWGQGGDPDMHKAWSLSSSGSRGLREIRHLYGLKIKSLKCLKRGTKCPFTWEKSNHFWLRELKEAFMTLALGLGLEEWEEWAHVEISQKVTARTVRARCRGETMPVPRMASGFPGTGGPGSEVKEESTLGKSPYIIYFLIFTAIVMFRCDSPTYNRWGNWGSEV